MRADTRRARLSPAASRLIAHTSIQAEVDRKLEDALTKLDAGNHMGPRVRE